MDRFEWAKREVEIASKDEDSYGVSCLEGALEAYKVLSEQGHSGASIQVTKSILDRLIDGKPLTPITDADFEGVKNIWDSPESLEERGLIDDLQCPRMSSLFKTIYKDGTVKYKDVNRVVCRNKYNRNNSYYNARGEAFVSNMFPITLPYSPKSKPYVVITDECLINTKEGDWDTEAWYEIITPEGQHIPINYFCKYIDGEEIEITEEEFNQRKNK